MKIRGGEKGVRKLGKIFLLIAFTLYRRNKGKCIHLSKSLRLSLGSENNYV